MVPGRRGPGTQRAPADGVVLAASLFLISEDQKHGCSSHIELLGKLVILSAREAENTPVMDIVIKDGLEEEGLASVDLHEQQCSIR